jgi:hypothetical protein
MSVTDIPDVVRAQLARSFIEHKADLGVPTATDDTILDHVDDILTILLDTTDEAVALRSTHWLRRYAWFVDLIGDIVTNRPGKPLNG